jgi:hypothetical protein
MKRSAPSHYVLGRARDGRSRISASVISELVKQLDLPTILLQGSNNGNAFKQVRGMGRLGNTIGQVHASMMHGMMPSVAPMVAV